MTRKDIEQKMDELTREYAKTHDPEILLIPNVSKMSPHEFTGDRPANLPELAARGKDELQVD